ncbi:MAG: AlpA family phage regulatory protein [Gammaproteobacteria bacterium]
MDRNESVRSAEWAGPIPSFMRLPDVLQATGLARSTVYRMVAEHTFPAPVKLAKRAVGWRHDDVRQWSDARPSTSERRPDF